ncbi:hypothetical protein C2E25_16000 [Geothermobacter hydrogeniphilus]|uniref:OmpA-like domain-containing protein n=1 Tax=Geothermobacter hydrogeniphilus TaxID=1969733 RepID=A0A2K2H6B4_9BACT|nr:OmpA family protein [Geothermobacter hydrogeniphilus]PNU18753.1 hypothetical protein C2E25_16000 [Geothermobacter hydrogeniphilus]
MNAKLRLVFLGVLAACLLCASLSAAAQPSVEDFLGTRKVVAVIPFSLGSAELGVSARHIIDQLVERLKHVNPKRKVVRLEGFSSPEGSEVTNINLSMKRAMAVENYLRTVRHLPPTRYLIGLGVAGGTTLDVVAQRRVEVVFYDNLLNMEDAEVDKVIIDDSKD